MAVRYDLPPYQEPLEHGYTRRDLKMRYFPVDLGTPIMIASTRAFVLSGRLLPSVPIATTTFPNQLPQALLAANVGALAVVLGETQRSND